MQHLEHVPNLTPQEVLLDGPDHALETTPLPPQPYTLILEFKQGNSQIRPISGKEAHKLMRPSLNNTELEYLILCDQDSNIFIVTPQGELDCSVRIQIKNNWFLECIGAQSLALDYGTLGVEDLEHLLVPFLTQNFPNLKAIERAFRNLV